MQILANLTHEEQIAYWRDTVRGELAAEIERLRAAILNIQALAEKGFPIDTAQLATRCADGTGAR